MEGFFLNNIQKTIEALEEAERLLKEHVNHPKNYNHYMSCALEVMSWNISDKISQLREGCL